MQGGVFASVRAGVLLAEILQNEVQGKRPVVLVSARLCLFQSHAERMEVFETREDQTRARSVADLCTEPTSIACRGAFLLAEILQNEVQGKRPVVLVSARLCLFQSHAGNRSAAPREIGIERRRRRLEESQRERDARIDGGERRAP
jgi:hypothetical protein